MMKRFAQKLITHTQQIVNFIKCNVGADETMNIVLDQKRRAIQSIILDAAKVCRY